MTEDFDLDFRPASYWGPQSLEQHYGSRITGELRRRGVKEQIGSAEVREDLLQPSLDAELRSTRGAMHPWFMGGEYLPPLLAGEVEIARVVLASVTMDVSSLRARRSGDRIYYRLVDEYMDMHPRERFKVRPAWSKAPLSMRQVIAIIDGNDLVDGPRDLNFDGMNIDDVYAFATTSSEFYPQLAVYYEAANERWREDKWREQEES